MPSQKDKSLTVRQKLLESIEHTIKELHHQYTTLLDLKIIDASLRELSHTSKVFAPYHHKRKVTVFGSARCKSSDPSYKQAKDFGRKMVDLGYMVLTGAGPGIMQAAQEGAGSAGSFGLNIQLPFEQVANPVIQGDSKLVNYKYFFTRKLTMIKESDALVLFPGGFGTQDELFETLTLLQTGKTTPTPVICVDKPGGNYWKTWKEFNVRELVRRDLISREDIGLVYFTTHVEQAIEHINKFYHNYHSIRFHNDSLLIRVWRLPPAHVAQALGHRFKDILMKGTITIMSKNLPSDPDIEDLSLKTLRLHFNQRNYGRLRQLIDVLNRY